MREHVFEGSSNIRSARFDEKDGVCVVTFTNGRDYAFGKFTSQAFGEWVQAPSAGAWFHRNVRARPDRFPRVEDARPTTADLSAVDIGLSDENGVDSNASSPPWVDDDVQLRIERENASPPKGSWRGMQPKVVDDDVKMSRRIVYSHDAHEWVDDEGNVWRMLRVRR